MAMKPKQFVTLVYKASKLDWRLYSVDETGEMVQTKLDLLEVTELSQDAYKALKRHKEIVPAIGMTAQPISLQDWWNGKGWYPPASK